MTTRIGVNGFGRIGRLVTRATLERYPEKLEVAAVNDLTDDKTNAHLFKYDTSYGVYPGQVEANNGDLIIDGQSIKVFSERDPSQIPWSEMGVDLVVESTGIFTDGERAGGHLQGGASKVIISAPATNVDLTMVLGVNDDQYDKERHNIVSNASCTTNCFAPMVKVLHEAFGIEHGLMSTIHSYTNDQAILDQRHSDLRRARGGCHEHYPHQHRCRPGRGTGAAGTQRQAAWHRLPGSHRHRLGYRLCGGPEPWRHRGRGKRGLQGCGRGIAEGHPGIHCGPDSQFRCTGQPPQLRL